MPLLWRMVGARITSESSSNGNASGTSCSIVCKPTCVRSKGKFHTSDETGDGEIVQRNLGRRFENGKGLC